MECIETHGCFGGTQTVWKHRSESLGCDMNVAVFLPSLVQREPRPVLYVLSGLTCTEQNFIQKSGAQRYAEHHGIVLVGPDTSPRGEGVPDEAGDDLGQGASFYVNATEAPWATHFRMEDYVVHELPRLIEAKFPVTEQRAICGHSMGGHGALTLALKYPGRYASVSALAPIVTPSSVPWGQRALSAYLGANPAVWRAHDTCELIAQAKERLPLLVDQGDADPFLGVHLHPEALKAACAAAGHPLTLRLQPGYDHGYYFIASFIGDHIAHHAAALTAAPTAAKDA